MKGIVTKLAVGLLTLALSVPMAEAQQRTTGNRGGGFQSNPSVTRPSAPGNGNQGWNPGNNNGPSNPGNGNQGWNFGNNNRPSNPGNGNQGLIPGNNNRPSVSGNGNPNVVAPSNNHQAARPSGVPTTGVRPNQSVRPGVTATPGNQPGNTAVWRPPYVNRAPVHVHRPATAARPWQRPVPPASWRPRANAPLISSILGITFGTALNMSLNYLLNSGYTISSYGSNTVYLSDVEQYNFYWPEATLYYGSNGLERTEFFYSTAYPDTARYMALYNNLTSIYGSPVNVSNVSSSMSATWFAPNKGYVTLQYLPQYSSGQLRFYTTLTTGL